MLKLSLRDTTPSSSNICLRDSYWESVVLDKWPLPDSEEDDSRYSSQHDQPYHSVGCSDEFICSRNSSGAANTFLLRFLHLHYRQFAHLLALERSLVLTTYDLTYQDRKERVSGEMKERFERILVKRGLKLGVIDVSESKHSFSVVLSSLLDHESTFSSLIMRQALSRDISRPNFSELMGRLLQNTRYEFDMSYNRIKDIPMSSVLAIGNPNLNPNLG